MNKLQKLDAVFNHLFQTGKSVLFRDLLVLGFTKQQVLAAVKKHGAFININEDGLSYISYTLYRPARNNSVQTLIGQLAN